MSVIEPCIQSPHIHSSQGVAVPDEVLSRSRFARAEQLYLQHVLLRPMRLNATVAMGASYVADPSRELLEVRIYAYRYLYRYIYIYIYICMYV